MLKSVFFVILLFSFTGISYAQSLSKNATTQAVIIPSSIYITSIVNQSGCPLKIENAYMLRYLKGWERGIYQVRNISKKSIRSFSIAIWRSDNTGDIVAWSARNYNGSFLPDNLVSNFPDDSTNLIPLNEDLKKNLFPNDELRSIVFFMIVHARFDDGTEYDDMQTFKRLEEHLKMFETQYDNNDKKGK